VTIFALAGFLATVAATAIVVGVHDVSLNEVSLGLTAGSAVLLAVVWLLVGRPGDGRDALGRGVREAFLGAGSARKDS